MYFVCVCMYALLFFTLLLGIENHESVRWVHLYAPYMNTTSMTTKHTSQIPFLASDGWWCYLLCAVRCLALPCPVTTENSSSSFFRFCFSMYGFDIFSFFQVRACVPAYTVFLYMDVLRFLMYQCDFVIFVDVLFRRFVYWIVLVARSRLFLFILWKFIH